MFFYKERKRMQESCVLLKRTFAQPCYLELELCYCGQRVDLHGYWPLGGDGVLHKHLGSGTNIVISFKF